ncbi:MAG TPA: LuxR C-terminal-related transcriptional regulator [Propionicimonas sp.]|uniref:helix-turn-helix transcriptional regulator n=1 Tax=Propionicimonas sp. TaxID=1955623 RepID=UPI002F419758
MTSTGAAPELAVPPGDVDLSAGVDADAPVATEAVAAAMSLFPRICPSGYRLASRRFGDGSEPDWPAFAGLLVDRGILERCAEPDGYLVLPRSRPELGAVMDDLGGADTVRAGLVDAWLAGPELELLDTVTAWARELCLWAALEEVWILLAEQTVGLSARTFGVFAALPMEARRTRPILSWAAGAAASLLADGPQDRVDAFWQRMLLDSATLHADWAVRLDSDEAVTAGTFRMIGERRLPSAHLGQALDAAWRTKESIDHLIDARSRSGKGPGRTPQSVFRAFSARLALFRYDAAGATSEARWARILSDWEPVAVLAKGIEALASSISTEDGPLHYSDPPLTGIGDGLGVCGLRGMGQLYEILADGNEAVRRLDRAGVERSLSIVTPDAAAVAGVWAVRVALQAWRDALWGDPEAGLTMVAEETRRLSLDGREADEPLGIVLLNRTRVVLLARAGAFTAATRVAETLPEEVRLVAIARIHLWAGQYRQAARIADQGPYQPGLEIWSRYRLALIRGAAAALEHTMTDGLRRDAVREVTRLVQSERYIHLALIPAPARAALLEMCLPELGHDPRLRQLQQRLGGLNDHASTGVPPTHLTERELVLLPMLATADPVPVIARNLQVSVSTVRKQVVTLREKFGAESRSEMIRKARIYGAIP